MTADTSHSAGPAVPPAAEPTMDATEAWRVLEKAPTRFQILKGRFAGCTASHATVRHALSIEESEAFANETDEALRALRAEHERTLAALRAAQRDTERLDWLDVAVPSGAFRDTLNAMPTTRWSGSIRELIDHAKESADAVR